MLILLKFRRVLIDVMGDCNGMDYLSFEVLNYDEIDPDLWAYWTSTGKKETKT